MILIKNTGRKVDKIFHISDIHVYNYQRHEEYIEVFEKLYKIIEERMTPNSIIFLGGDIVHSKTNMSPELFSVVSNLLSTLCNMLPTIVILGNHDLNLNNKTRLDALTPIINSLNLPTLHFLNETNVYQYEQIGFSLLHVKDKIENVIPAKSFDAETKILMYHGPVKNSATAYGYLLEGNYLDVLDHADYDYILLGDIHKHQYLNLEKTAAYPSSLIQQNFGEDLTHGIIEWDLNKNTSEFIKIASSHGYYTFKLKNDKVAEKIPGDLPYNLNVAITAENCTQEFIDSFCLALEKKYNVLRIKKPKVTKFIIDNGKGEVSLDKENIIRDFEWRHSMLERYVQNELKQEYQADKFLDIHKTASLELDEPSEFIGVTWKPIRFEFSNMFSYGEGNVFNLGELGGLVGLFSPNASGKSTLLDAMTYCIFDKCSKTSSGAEVMNTSSNFFSCKLELSVAGESYFIERNGKKGKDGKVKVIVNFYKEDGTSLNGEQRYETNDSIRKYLGSYENFMLITMYDQHNKSDFIDKTQKDKKDLLYKYFDIDIFEKLNDTSKEHLKQLKYEIENHQKQKYNESVTEYENNIIDIKSKLTQVETSLELNKKSSDVLSIQIENKRKELTPYPKQSVNYATKIDEESRNEATLSSSLEDKRKSFVEARNALKTHLSELESMGEVADVSSDLVTIRKTLSDFDRDIAVAESEIKSSSKLIDHLQGYEHDPNCVYCVKNNKYALEGEKAKKEYPELLNKLDKLKQSKNELGKSVKNLETADSLYKKYNDKKNETERLKSNLDNIESQANIIKEKIQISKNLILDYSEKLKEQESYKDIEQKNAEIDSEIAKLLDEKKLIDDAVYQLAYTIGGHKSTITSNESKIKDIKIKIKKFKDDTLTYNNYFVFEKATRRDGIPLFIIKNYLPVLENVVNDALKNVAAFNVQFELSDKTLEVFISYVNGPKWPLSLASGMERFISSLAIRAALNHVTVLPKPDFFFIDEGFGVLDSDNIANVGLFLEELTSYFRFILCISHLDVVKDYVAKELFIVKDNGHSQLIS
jgi:predicted MPP superfamily phosphohydrolase/energy-coupling factor transporter ATP-binding protein EcfA2